MSKVAETVQKWVEDNIVILTSLRTRFGNHDRPGHELYYHVVHNFMKVLEAEAQRAERLVSEFV